MGSALLSQAIGQALPGSTLLYRLSWMEQVGGDWRSVGGCDSIWRPLTSPYSLLLPLTPSYLLLHIHSGIVLRAPQRPSVSLSTAFVLSCVVLSRADLSLRTPGTENLTCSSCHSRRRVPSDSSPNSWSTNRTSTPSSPILAIQLVGL